MKQDHAKAQEEVNQNFDAQIAALIAEHKKAVAAEKEEHAAKQASSKSALEERIGNMETETTEVINDIKEKNLDGINLTSYIPTLDQQWFTIEWSEKNRQLKPEPTPWLDTNGRNYKSGQNRQLDEDLAKPQDIFGGAIPPEL